MKTSSHDPLRPEVRAIMAKKPSVNPEETHQATEALRRFWKAGSRSLARLQRMRQRTPQAYRHGNKMEVLTQEATKYGYNPDTMKKSWRIAEEYTSANIEEMCALVEQHQARFGPSHLIRLLTVPDRARRDALTRKAIRNRWGVIRLDQAILRQRRRRPLVGKHPQTPDDPVERLVVLEGLCLKWVRWCEAASSGLSEDLRGMVESATRAVRRVQTSVARQGNRT